MEELKFSVSDWYEIQAQLLGHVQPDGKVDYCGLVNETDITEGTKRAAYRTGKIILKELEPILEQYNKLDSFQPEEEISAQDLAQLRATKKAELFADQVPITIEKLQFAKVENAKLSANYQFIYDKVFN